MMTTFLNGIRRAPILLFYLSVTRLFSQELTLHTVDPLEKVFPDSKPESLTGLHRAEAARGEYASFQIVFRHTSPLHSMRVSFESPFPEMLQEALKIRYVGHIRREAHQDRIEPELFPDPLWTVPPTTIRANSCQAIWLTVPVPKDARPGTYKVVIAIQADDEDGEPVRGRRELELRVHEAVLGKQQLRVSNWVHFRKELGIPLFSDEFWAAHAKWAANVVAHRQNQILVRLGLAGPETSGEYPPFKYGHPFNRHPPFHLTLIRPLVTESGRMAFDFSRFDRFITTYRQAGIQWVAGGQFIVGIADEKGTSSAEFGWIP
ncbi:MAG: hypothetical protein HN742_33965 [Lentisphaerae bacterium]|nr:hypothetical protein [Lentisphaerota bacterium]MBT4819263.1 hypothetical protein [Lentisphaerota bacterium]MBT5609116.1 hypothetical protein [Lentisphaerota bacterium]MBT7061198.1 hypothetical protein [Lentisphaerota bacterium]MBT7846928.1 hypothetical protein [Lentisphaerota bacterium]